MGLARAGSQGLVGLVEDIAGFLVRRQECLDGRPEFGPPCARLLQKGGALVGRSGQRFLEQGFFAHGFGSGLAGDFFANSSISFLKSSRPRMGSRSVSFAMCAASL